jgi:bifunctional UDP-N-acetylglucosamine pyrophosphorylase/glucosamine-1-phosphate N-acetyltransferase
MVSDRAAGTSRHAGGDGSMQELVLVGHVIDAEVEVGPDTVIEPFVQILGRTRIGGDCRIRSYSVIQNSEIGDRVTVRPGSILDEARVAADAVIGPYSHLRPGSEIGEGAHVGNFVETKNIKLGKQSRRIT